MTPLAEEEVEQWVTETMPEQFLHMNHPLHSNYSLARVLEWIQARPFLDRQTMVDMGGPGGIRYVFFLLLRMFIQANDLLVAGDSKFKARFVNTATITAYGEIAIQIISTHLSDSMAILKTTAEARKLSANQELAFEELPHPAHAQQERPITPLHPDDKTISSGVAPSAALGEHESGVIEDSINESLRQANVDMEDSPVVAGPLQEPRMPKKAGSGLLGAELGEVMRSPRRAISAPSLREAHQGEQVSCLAVPTLQRLTWGYILGG
jgi:hypothetical protein